MTAPLDLLKQSIRLYRDHAQLFAGYASWLLFTYAAYVLLSFIPNETWQIFPMFAISITEVILGMWVGIIVTLATVDFVNGKTPDPAKLPSAAWVMIWPFALVSLLQGLITLGGLLLLIIPGVIFSVWFAYAQQVVMIDGKRSAMEALSASRELVRGRFATVTWYLVVGPVLVGLVYFAALAMLFFALSALTGVPMDVITGDTPPMWVETISNVSEIFLLPLFYIYWVLTYLELKKPYARTGDRT